jgi:hypothetical protein
VGEIAEPILEFVTKRFLISQLGGNLPVGDSFATVTHNGLRICPPFAFGGGIDDRVIRKRFLAFWANYLVFHFHSFPEKLVSTLL